MSDWFRTRMLESGLFVTLEPAVAPMFQAAMVTVPGRDRDLHSTSAAVWLRFGQSCP